MESTWRAGVHCGWQGNWGWGRVLNRSSLKVSLADTRHQSRLENGSVLFVLVSICWTGTVPYSVTLLPVQNEASEHTVPLMRWISGFEIVWNWQAQMIWQMIFFLDPGCHLFLGCLKKQTNVAQSSDIHADFRTVQFQLMLFSFGIPPERSEKLLTVSLAFVHHHHCPDGTATFSFISCRS